MVPNFGQNSEHQLMAKPRGKPFEKGRSGNPGGRPKVVGEIRDLARAHTVAAIQTLVEIHEDKSAPPAARAHAANALLDRGWGRATQPVEHDAGPNVLDLMLSVIHESGIE